MELVIYRTPTLAYPSLLAEVICTKAVVTSDHHLGYQNSDKSPSNTSLNTTCMQNDSEVDHHLLEYVTSIATTLLFAVLYGILEYYWIVTSKDVPFRYGSGPVFLGFYLYHLEVMLPILLIVGFSPLIADILGTGNKVREKGFTFALGCATILFSIMLEDITWFSCRSVDPLPLDPLAGKWIQPSDWTARGSLGYLSIPGGVIPSWYIIVAIIAVLIWAAVFKHWSLLTVRLEPFRISFGSDEHTGPDSDPHDIPDELNDKSLKPRKKELLHEMEGFRKHLWKLHLYNFRLNWVTVIVALALTAGVTVAGVYGNGQFAAVFGVGIAFLIGLQNAFPLSEKAEFYRTIVAEYDNLKDDLMYCVETEKQFKQVLHKFEALRDNAAKKRPKGHEFQAEFRMQKG